jgi:hypothetical protein
MKKIVLLAILITMFSIAYAQTDSISILIKKRSELIGHGGNNEIKINILGSVAGFPEISYERILEDNMSVGISVIADAANDEYYGHAVIPNFRLFFGKKKASGFFIEANTGVFNMKSYYNYATDRYIPDAKTGFGLGVAVGGKFLARNGYLAEIYAGGARLFLNKNLGYQRIGVTIGKRF